MNIKKSLSLVVVSVFAFTVSAYACPGCPDAKKTAAKVTKAEDGVQVKTVSTKKPCCSKGAKATTVASKKGCSGDCSKGCSKGCGKSAAKAKTVAGKKGCSKRCGKSGAKLTSSKPTCHKAAARSEKVDAILASLPSMTYKVGEMETACCKSANAEAAASGAKIAYVVDGKSYESKGEATVTLAGLMTEKYSEMSHVQFVAGDKCYKCPVTASKIAEDAKTKMKYRLAGFDFDSKEQANKVAAEVQEAMAGMKIKYMSEGKPVTCVKSCKKAGKKVTYVVGDQETECEQSAKLMLAEFVARSIVELVAESAS